MCKCITCDNCDFETYNGSPSRWYCTHEKNPSKVKGNSPYTKINQLRTLNKEDIPRKNQPRWCPLREE